MEGLAKQTLPAHEWELVLVDNGSEPAVMPEVFAGLRCATRVVREPRVGLTPARLAGIRAAAGDVIVLVDDDNVLTPSYLAANTFRAGGLLEGPITDLVDVAIGSTGTSNPRLKKSGQLRLGFRPASTRTTW